MHVAKVTERFLNILVNVETFFEPYIQILRYIFFEKFLCSKQVLTKYLRQLNIWAYKNVQD